MKKLAAESKNILVIALLLILLLLGVLLHLHANDNSGDNKHGQVRDSYDFVLNNDSFTGKYNHQELGDYQICFRGDIKSFSGLTVGKGSGEEVWKEWLQITGDEISVFDVQKQTVVDSFSHNIAFKDYIAVNIIAGLNGKAKIEILTNGDSFIKENVNWTGRNGRLFAEATGGNTVLDNCSISYYCSGWNKDIWMYGDSYFSMTAKDRWTTYLVHNGASNILLSGRDGEGSLESLDSFRTQLLYGTPETVVWCVGMNDGDSEDEINRDYKKCLDEVIRICKEKDIELILATIPTCPYWCNDYKNEYIKTLDYTIIDFAGAVGSYESTTWNENMLEDAEKRIHPTAEGAIALYTKAVATLPDLLEQ